MIQKYYKYKDKIIEADENHPLLLPILGIITKFIRDNEFDLRDLHIVVSVNCNKKANPQSLMEILVSLSEIGLIRLVEKSCFEWDNIYRSNICYSDYRYIIFKLYNR